MKTHSFKKETMKTKIQTYSWHLYMNAMLRRLNYKMALDIIIPLLETTFRLGQRSPLHDCLPC